VIDETFMSEARRKVSLAKLFGKAEEEAQSVPLPRPLQDALRTASVNSYGPLVHSSITGDTLTLVFSNGKRATYRPDRRVLLASYGSPELATVIARHGWAEQLRLTAAS
jgi:protein gp37